MPRYSLIFFLFAAGFLCTGIGMGAYMALARDHALAPVHVHINLLGWVSAAIMGLFYAQVGDRLPRWLIWTQAAVYLTGVPVMMTGLTGLVLGFPALTPLAPIGMIATVAGVLLFAAAVIRIAFISGEARDAR
jgi:hypothetical protein